MKELFKNKRFTAVYGLWAFVHSILLLLGDRDGTNQFWPLTKWSYRHSYDFSEWFVYVLTPLVLIFLISAFKDQRDDRREVK